MSTQLTITVHFLDNAFHGRGDGGDPEWPPSPLRLFQAIVNAAATCRDAIPGGTAAALRWFENLPPPEIRATRRHAIQPEGRGFKTYVPNNQADIVASSWTRGGDASMADHRAEKYIRPVRLEAPADGFAAVQYTWQADGPPPDALVATVRSVSHLGWGLDMVVANVGPDSDGMADSAERYLPTVAAGGVELRSPIPGTFDALVERHTAFLKRIDMDSGVFTPVPPLSAFATTVYRHGTDLAQSPYAVFALRRPDDSAFAAFEPARRGMHVAGMMRYAASTEDFVRALGWDNVRANAIVLGHGRDSAAPDSRLAFIPLPSFEWQGGARGATVGAVRRVLVVARGPLDGGEFARVIRELEGRELVDEDSKEAVAFLRREMASERAVSAFFGRALEWASVTPVILPGFDDKKGYRKRIASGTLSAAEKNSLVGKLAVTAEGLLRKALSQAGYPDSIVSTDGIEWRGTGYLPGVGMASAYAVPSHVRRYPRFHVRVRFVVPVSGPVCIGSGRHFGLGLFAAVPA